MQQGSYLGHCPTDQRQGYQSQARPPQTAGCAPGSVPPMCDTVVLIDEVIPAGLVLDVTLGPYQPLQPLGVLDIASAAGVELVDVFVNGQQLSSKFQSDSGTTVDGGLGPVTFMDKELYRSGLNNFWPSPMVDNNNQCTFRYTGLAADVVSLFLYFGNPLRPGHTMQKAGNGNY